ncbi:hypothetical protein [Sphingosinicella sp. BN140058]|uniref:hypothetical protein n=1 Tax=Sphingosinicella sp. BN140058 TaxID=1892855 RepID=UPI0010124E9E|nr:hypothetical protein [Sphingosinicella sp. BN140058]QAY80264.1 hypothetical protein ETR14_26840 [Sphingosinicella sp. BN140058]
MTEAHDPLAALRAMFAPATRVIAIDRPPDIRATRCDKCPFGDGLTESEQRAADILKARLAGRLSAGESVIWGCHETVDGSRPQVCNGFAEWTRERPDLE